eukprot:TRINITY_DN3887_c0_g1_i1.p1 TRINITY_DN3887_c0_g1~~TRINITY_DN3887_c0_g1_i1.p1  ORF type:complete len:536 (+),score=186.26 TRINITY_DN3887_c0_g1_i1:26-1609(+)
MALALLCAAAAAAAARPNFVYVLTDDTDVLLGSERALPQTQRLVADAGARFSHFLTHSPKCTPSRTGQLVGRHYHNVRPAGWEGRPFGGGLNQTTMFERTGLFAMLHDAGYLTSIVGKVHNDQNRWLCTPQNRTACFDHVSTLCDPCGKYWGTKYVEKPIGAAAPHLPPPLDQDAWSTYSHAQFSNRSLAFMKDAVRLGKPFFAYIGTTGPHVPAQPAPWHAETVRGWHDSVYAPRTPSFNKGSKNAHPTLEAMPVVDDGDVHFMDNHFRDRLGTLLSVDDLVAEVVHGLGELGVLDNTYVLFSADHGYHIGNYKLPNEKMWHWETDIRIPFYMRGPGIAAGQVLPSMGVNIDIAPTLLDLAGVLDRPSDYDGKSLRSLVMGGEEARASAAAAWRTRTVIAFAEGYTQKWDGPLSALGNAAGAAVADPKALMTFPGNNSAGVPYTFDNPENQWRMLRVANATHNVSVVQWDPTFHFHPQRVAFTAYYDHRTDEHMMDNTWGALPEAVQAQWVTELSELFACAGATCP